MHHISISICEDSSCNCLYISTTLFYFSIFVILGHISKSSKETVIKKDICCTVCSQSDRIYLNMGLSRVLGLVRTCKNLLFVMIFLYVEISISDVRLPFSRVIFLVRHTCNVCSSKCNINRMTPFFCTSKISAFICLKNRVISTPVKYLRTPFQNSRQNYKKNVGSDQKMNLSMLSMYNRVILLSKK